MADGLEPVESVAKKIIKAGWKALCQKNHPDVGGTENAMKALNLAKEWLEGLVDNGSSNPLDLIFGGGFRRGGRSWYDTAQADHEQREREAKQAAREARQAAEREEAERAGRVRSGPTWTEIDGVVAANETSTLLCCRFDSYLIHWIPFKQIAKDSPVRRPGDSGVLRVRTAYARKHGLA